MPTGICTDGCFQNEFISHIHLRSTNTLMHLMQDNKQRRELWREGVRKWTENSKVIGDGAKTYHSSSTCGQLHVKTTSFSTDTTRERAKFALPKHQMPHTILDSAKNTSLIHKNHLYGNAAASHNLTQSHNCTCNSARLHRTPQQKHPCCSQVVPQHLCFGLVFLFE